jgi:hypothetical protein
MTSQPKPRRKKGLEPLDWRELAEAPALRGLTEILSTPPEVARERASKRAEISGQETPAGALDPRDVSPTVGVSGAFQDQPLKIEFPALTNPVPPPSVGPLVLPEETPTVGGSPVLRPTDDPVHAQPEFGALTELSIGAQSDTKCVAVSPTVSDTPTVGQTDIDSPVIQGRAEGILPISISVSEVSASLPSSKPAPSVGHSTTEDGTASEVGSSSVGDTPTVGKPDRSGYGPGVSSSKIGGQSSTAHNSGAARGREHYQSTAPPLTVGVSPSVQRYAWWLDDSGTRYENKRVQRVVIAQHSMSLGEERVYQTLWHGRESDGIFIETKRSKTFSLGYDRIARLVRLNEKSVRVLLPKLISKKILQVLAAENSASRVGRTYRIFNYEEILERQRAANLTNVVKNGRAVEFVWPETVTVGETPTHPEATRSPRPEVVEAPGVKPTVGETPTVKNKREAAPDFEASRQDTQRYPAELAPKVQAIIGSFDDDAVRTLWAKCVQQAPDCTSEEIEYCLSLKAHQLLVKGKSITNPVGLMLWAVPKCFEGPAALHLAFREQKRAEEEARRRADEQFRLQLEEYRRLLADPNTTPEDRAWYERLLNDVS